MRKRVTISIDETVYEGLVRVIGRRKISQFLEDLARPYAVNDDLLAGYRPMAADTVREREALEWSEALVGDAADAARCSLAGGLRSRDGR
jgi:predicted CopG family antitoxin